MDTRAIKNRIGGFLAIAAMIGFLAMSAIVAMHQIPISNKDYFNMCLIAIIGLCTTAFGYYLGSSAGSARKTEIAIQPVAVPPSDNSQSGQVKTLVMPVLAALMLLAAALPWMMSGCTAQQQGAVRQLSAQTSDPATIALGTYADAQDAYITAADLYQPYQSALRQSNPDLDAELVGYLRAANKILEDWRIYGEVDLDDKATFRQYLREISIRTAQMIEQGGKR
jgi:hypothetical protein